MKSEKQKFSTDFSQESAPENKSPGKSDRRTFLKQSLIASAGIATVPGTIPGMTLDFKPKSGIKIIDLKCAVMGDSPVVRIVTDAGISGYGQAETHKAFLKPFVLFYKDYLVGEDPTNVQRIMLKIRRLGSFKPWGSAVSSIEMALWDIAGKVAGLPVYKLLGGKIRDHVRVYNGGVKLDLTGTEPGDYAKAVKATKEGFTIIKGGLGFHTSSPTDVPNFFYGNTTPSASLKNVKHSYRGPITEQGLKYMIKYVENFKRGLGDEIGLAFDCGPGFMVSDAIRLARALEPFNLLWLEDLITGDYTPYVLADMYREVTQSTTTPIHTGEQIYLRENFRELIEQKAVRVLGPDPNDIGGIAELKWVAEYADLHGIQIAPHGIFDGLFGLAAHVHVGAAMPENYIAFEYPVADPGWWYNIVDGLPDPIVKNGLIKVWDSPGLGVDFNIKAAKQYLLPEDKNFFD
jgi:L-alanine-DL-glutamate epimerase-like enolase superfamily enzyme